ncbi:MAG: DoxX family membrane protein [Actinomycetota bacterium]|jgi:thiosulfate dehydrogenase [quinone] large subunit|nr:DoxX family membrane protein [Actinomycetota bacterium]
MRYVTALIGEPAERRTPKVLQWLATSQSAAVVWTAARVWLGIMWIQAGVSKVWGAENPGFMHNGGAGVAGFAAHGAASYSWWASFLHSFVVPNAGWIGVLVSFSELAAGIALALGFLTPVAAGGALLLNVTYMLSGTAGVNPVYALFAILLLATWRTSGWIGIDGLLLGFRQHHHVHWYLFGRDRGVVETLADRTAA